MIPEPRTIHSALTSVPGISKLLSKLHENGKITLHLFGGAVRDLILTGRVGHDLDFLVVREPEAKISDDEFLTLVQGVCSACGCASRIYERDHIVLFGFASPLTVDLHYPSDSVMSGLGRSDFTINGIAYDTRRGAFVDPLGGLSDIATLTLRIHSPHYVYTNPPNFPRMYRTAMKTGFVLSKELRAEFSRYAPLISITDGKTNYRVMLEFAKLLSLPKVVPTLRLMLEDGVLQQIIPELIPLSEVPPSNGSYKTTLERNFALIKASEERAKEASDIKFLERQFAPVPQITFLGILRLYALFIGFGDAYYDLSPQSPYMQGLGITERKDFVSRIERNMFSFFLSRYKDHAETALLFADFPSLVSTLGLRVQTPPQSWHLHFNQSEGPSSDIIRIFQGWSERIQG